MSEKLTIRLKRSYDPPAKSDGRRILVDRVWPRGVSKEELRLDGWMKEVAPSTELRKWFDHDRSKWAQFKARYFEELEENADIVETLLAKAGIGPLTLVYGAKDTACNNAVALKDYLDRSVGSPV